MKRGSFLHKIIGDGEDIAREEMSDNKGNWHPPSNYTMYQTGF